MSTPGPPSRAFVTITNVDHQLTPPGWWEFLLRSQDGDGRLLPEGPLDPGLPWPAIQRHAESMLLAELPEDIARGLARIHHDELREAIKRAASVGLATPSK